MSQAAERDARTAVLKTARDMSSSGLSPGRSGNVSMRWKDGLLITPSAMRYDDMTVGDIVLLDGRGVPHDPEQVPSSEWRFHLAALSARQDRHAVVHTHSRHATALACLGRDIPAFHYMVAVAGGADIPLVPYAMFGTQALSDHVANGLAHRDACLMAHHGQVALGTSPAAALELANEVEVLAAQYVSALSIGTPDVLGTSEMEAVLEAFSSYGANKSVPPSIKR